MEIPQYGLASPNLAREISICHLDHVQPWFGTYDRYRNSEHKADRALNDFVKKMRVKQPNVSVITTIIGIVF